jgi:7-carboxy-7-deazaguanine synthase
MLRLIEIFESVQGETSLAGLATTFIRLAGCNLRCVWCDTPYSFGKGDKVAIEAILNQVQTYGHRHVCVTGGEPLLQRSVHDLMKRLSDLGKIVSLETGGSLTTENVDSRVKVILDIKCPASGMEEKNLYSNLNFLKKEDEVKFVIQDIQDYLFAKDICKKWSLFDRSVPPLFSPVFGTLDPKLLVEWSLKDKLFFRLNLQQHKYIWTPQTRGV